MNSYLISYDLMNPGKDYSDLYERIKSYQAWAHVLESVWVVKSSSSAVQIRDNLMQVMDSNDKLFVAKLSGEAAWYNLSESISKWLKENL